jgi:cell division septum initiation protein DivIVA
MANSNLVALKAKLTRERRTNRRLRAVIEELREQLRQTRHDVDLHFQRFAQLQAEVDRLKLGKPQSP